MIYLSSQPIKYKGTNGVKNKNKKQSWSTRVSMIYKPITLVIRVESIQDIRPNSRLRWNTDEIEKNNLTV